MRAEYGADTASPVTTCGKAELAGDLARPDYLELAAVTEAAPSARGECAFTAQERGLMRIRRVR
jgi:hypothetical protein